MNATGSSAAPSPSIDRSVDPMDFGDPTAQQLGNYEGMGTIDNAISRVVARLDDMKTSHQNPRFQFLFNGTPVVVDRDTTVAQGRLDWHQRRVAYQRAAGITV